MDLKNLNCLHLATAKSTWTINKDYILFDPSNSGSHTRFRNLIKLVLLVLIVGAKLTTVMCAFIPHAQDDK